MKLAAIYNVFDGLEWLGKSIFCIKNHVDLVIITYQDVSNYGEKYNNFEIITRILEEQGLNNAILYKYSSQMDQSAMYNETLKRQIGIELALKNQCTHFLHIDCDELYYDFERLKQEYIECGLDGSVCEMYTYFKTENFRLEDVDNYFVPFIHKLHTETSCGIRNNYPYYVDPTRRINCEDVTLLKSGKMHHYSWVRDDINLKIRNSSAKLNIEKSQLLSDYLNLECKEGYFLKDFGQKLVKTNTFIKI